MANQTYSDPSTWQSVNFNPFQNLEGNGGSTYYLDPTSGNLFGSQDATSPLLTKEALDFSKSLSNVSVPNMVNMGDSGMQQSGMKNQYFLGEDPTQIAKDYSLYQSNPNAFNAQTAQNLSNSLFSTWAQNGNNLGSPFGFDPTSQQQDKLNAFKQTDPQAYYNAVLSQKAKEIGWDAGQNKTNQDNNAQFQNLAREAMAAGLSSNDINNIFNSNYQTTAKMSAERAVKDGLNIGSIIAAVVVAVVAPELAPAIGASLGLTGAAATAAGTAAIGAGSAAIVTAANGGTPTQIADAALIGGATGAVGGVAAPVASEISSVVGADAASIIANAATGATRSAISGNDPIAGAATGAVGTAIAETGVPSPIAAAGAGALSGALTNKDPLASAIASGVTNLVSTSGTSPDATINPATGEAYTGSDQSATISPTLETPNPTTAVVMAVDPVNQTAAVMDSTGNVLQVTATPDIQPGSTVSVDPSTNVATVTQPADVTQPAAEPTAGVTTQFLPEGSQVLTDVGGGTTTPFVPAEITPENEPIEPASIEPDAETTPTPVEQNILDLIAKDQPATVTSAPVEQPLPVTSEPVEQPAPVEQLATPEAPIAVPTPVEQPTPIEQPAPVDQLAPVEQPAPISPVISPIQEPEPVESAVIPPDQSTETPTDTTESTYTPSPKTFTIGGITPSTSSVFSTRDPLASALLGSQGPAVNPTQAAGEPNMLGDGKRKNVWNLESLRGALGI